MEQAELEAVRRQFDEGVRSRFPQGTIRQAEVLQYGDVPEVEPGQLLARVIVETPDDEEGRKQAFESLHESHRTAFRELRKELNKLPVPVILQFRASGEPGEIAGKREGNPGGGRVQRGGDFGKRRQIHIDGERTDGGERAQYDDDQISVFGLRHKLKSAVKFYTAF